MIQLIYRAKIKWVLVYSESQISPHRLVLQVGGPKGVKRCRHASAEEAVLPVRSKVNRKTLRTCWRIRATRSVSVSDL